MWERLKAWRRDWQRRQRERQLPEGRVLVVADEIGVSAVYPDGSRQHVRWERVLRVVIETNDTGPWGADVWWILQAADSRCAYPQGATGENDAMQAYGQRLPGFDWEAVIRANGSTGNASFLCWEKGRAG